MTDEVSKAIQSWCLAELAPWQGRRLSYSDVCEEHRRLSEARSDIAIFNIRDGIVSVSGKPQHLVGFHLRVRHYLELLQAAVATYKLDIQTQLAFYLQDELYSRHPSDSAPIWAFQKPAGSSAILLPDIDLLDHDFYTDFSDNIPYEQKLTSAMFVGSTSGANYSEQIVHTLAAPRLRAAVHFKNTPRVRFLLTQIVQCDTERTEALLHEMGFGCGGRISIEEQMMHKLIISMDGNGAACSRVAIALKSNSALLKYNSECLLYYFSHLIPWRHYIPIEEHKEVEDLVQNELDAPCLFRFVATEGRAFAERYLTKEVGIQYTAELVNLYANIFRLTRNPISQSTLQASSRASTDRPDDGETLVEFDCIGHIANSGDRWARGGTWLGTAGSKLAIEGFMLQCRPNVPGVSYQAVLQDGTLTSGTVSGEFCGTRGADTPICGLKINLDGEAAAQLECYYSATFIDGSKVGPVPNGQTCQSATLVALESFQIAVRSRSTCDGEATGTLGAPETPVLSRNLRAGPGV